MSNLFVTSDEIGQESGGGVVTKNELQALRELGEVDIINPLFTTNNPFDNDERGLAEYKNKKKRYELAHFYSGTFSKLTRQLKEDGTKITWTIAAHDVIISKEEHENLGTPFNYPHLIMPELWHKYIEGYLLSDVIICPGTLPKSVVEEYDDYKDTAVVVIPHGVDLPSEKDIKPISDKSFVCSYLGVPGADKGLIYLIQAWKKLNYNDALLIIAGNNTEMLLPLVRGYGGGAIHLHGWANKPSDVYNNCSCYIQPSMTEGFGLEVLEAMSYGRPVICSSGAGAKDCIRNNVDGLVVERRNVDALCQAIDYYKKNPNKIIEHGANAKEKAKEYTWDKVKKQYQELWRSL